MPASSHARSGRSSLALAAGGIGVLIAAAAVLRYAAEAIGTVPAALLAVWAVAGCGLAHSLRPRREPRMARPAPVRLPERSVSDLEPAA